MSTIPRDQALRSCGQDPLMIFHPWTLGLGSWGPGPLGVTHPAFLEVGFAYRLEIVSGVFTCHNRRFGKSIGLRVQILPVLIWANQSLRQWWWLPRSCAVEFQGSFAWYSSFQWGTHITSPYCLSRSWSRCSGNTCYPISLHLSSWQAPPSAGGQVQSLVICVSQLGVLQHWRITGAATHQVFLFKCAPSFW